MDTNVMTKQVAVVTGAGRSAGLGFEIARQLGQAGLRVVLTARDGAAARGRAAELAAEGLDVVGATLDVTDVKSVREFAQGLARCDVLVNNAAGTASAQQGPSKTSLDEAHEVFEATLFGAWQTTQALMGLLEVAPHPRVVNVSSGAGSHADPLFGLHAQNAMGPAYAVSKAALNALTVAFSRELLAKRVLVNAVCPGFTATFPGGEQMGARPVKESAKGVVWAATLPDDGPTGGFFRDGAPLGW